MIGGDKKFDISIANRKSSFFKILYYFLDASDSPTTEPDAGDTEFETGSGASSNTNATLTDFLPRLNVFEPNRSILIDTATSRLFINVSYNPGHPEGFLVWKHNYVVISSRTDPRVTVLSGGGLTIRNLRPSDRGVYTVMVSNRLGSGSANFTVFIQCKRHIVFIES